MASHQWAIIGSLTAWRGTVGGPSAPTSASSRASSWPGWDAGAVTCVPSDGLRAATTSGSAIVRSGRLRRTGATPAARSLRLCLVAEEHGAGDVVALDQLGRGALEAHSALLHEDGP